MLSKCIGATCRPRWESNPVIYPCEGSGWPSASGATGYTSGYVPLYAAAHQVIHICNYFQLDKAGRSEETTTVFAKRFPALAKRIFSFTRRPTLGRLYFWMLWIAYIRAVYCQACKSRTDVENCTTK